MDAIVRNWIENCGCDNIKTCLFCQHVGAVACGAKSAAIIHVNKADFIRCRQIKNRISVKVISCSGSRYKVFVYNRSVLYEILNRPECKRVLARVGYKDTDIAESMICQLVDRIRHQTEFPHEIGVFLGYPLKDVCGYMGINGLKLTKKMGWHMYGETSESERIYMKQKEIRQEIARILNEMQYLTV